MVPVNYPGQIMYLGMLACTKTGLMALNQKTLILKYRNFPFKTYKRMVMTVVWQ